MYRRFHNIIMEPRWIPLEKEVSKSKAEGLAIARHRTIMGDPEVGEKTSADEEKRGRSKRKYRVHPAEEELENSVPDVHSRSSRLG